MPQNSHRLSQLSLTKLALLAKQAHAQVEDVLHAEPIAIIGMGCRFPGGADDPQSYWDLLRRATAATQEVPADRWDAATYYDADFAAPGKMNTRRGGYLQHIDGFDADFFGITPREAERMDPQQRLLLEVAFEALEDAGLVHEQLAGSLTSVFVASYHNDYTQRQYADLDTINLRTLTGTLHSIAANRISFLLDLRGPSMALDTACSSSLVAVHLACQSLRMRESNLSLAGGVSLMISPAVNIALSKVGFMAADGTCYSFDSRAAGFGRGEGCGVIVLKRLADALVDGDHVLAVIRGSAINQDGRSTVLTAPNGRAQQAVVRMALQHAGIAPEQVSHIEAHGTGTLLGDPIEVEALIDVLGQVEAGAPACALTSVKTNFGHLEAAAGIAGLIKVVLSLQHAAIPAHLHLRELNPHISLTGTRLFIPTQLTPWPAGANPRVAGVSSFGIGGTNAHVLLAEASSQPQAAAPDHAEIATVLLPLSARSPAALAALCARYDNLLAAAQPQFSPAEICGMAALHRNHYEYRLAVVGSSHSQLRERLQAAIAQQERSGAWFGHLAAEQPPSIVFVFSGQGPQWWAMGRELLAEEAIFRAVVERCDHLLLPYTGWSLLSELNADEDASRLNETEVAQPALFALQMGLDALWRAWGIAPAAVIGHSVGEIAAACSAGSLSLEQAIHLVYHRARLMQRATGGGRMASVELPLAAAESLIAAFDGRISIAAVNGPSTTVLSGESAALQMLLQQLEQAKISFRELHVNYAFHSRQMAGLADELEQALTGLLTQRADIPIYSTVTGQDSDGLDLDAAYWGRNMRQTVRFADAIQHAAQSGLQLFVEVSPHPVLAASVTECLAAGGLPGTAFASLRRRRPERENLLTTLAELYALGSRVNWSSFYPAPGRYVPLPLYPWQRRRYWLEVATPSAPGAPALQESLLGPPLRSPAVQGLLFQSHLSAGNPAFLADHQIFGHILLPATGYLAMALSAGRTLWPSSPVQVVNLVIHAALALPQAGQHTLQLHLQPQATNESSTGQPTAQFQIFSSSDEQDWTLHAAGELHVDRTAHNSVTPSLAALHSRLPEQVAPDEYYRRLAGQGFMFGPSFRSIAALWWGAGEALAEVAPPPALLTSSDLIHPALLDAALQPLTAALPSAEGSAVYLPVSLDALRVLRAPGARFWSHLRLCKSASAPAGTPDTVTCDVTLFDEAGVIAEISGLHLLRTNVDALRRIVARQEPNELGRWFYRVEWQPQPLPAAAFSSQPPGQWLLFADHSGVADALAQQLRSAGQHVCLVTAGEAFARQAQDRWTIAAGAHADYQRLVHTLVTENAQPLRGVIYLWGMNLPPADADLLPAQESSLGGLLHLAPALSAAGVNQLDGLWLVTRNSQAHAQTAPAVEQSPLWGMAASMALELPDLHLVCIDLALYSTPQQDSAHVWDEIVNAGAAQQVAWQGEKRHTLQLVRSQPTTAETANQRAEPDEPLQLMLPRRGVLDDLTAAPAARRLPAAGEVEIRVHAAGLNFRDVLKALDQYPWDLGPLGDECAGEVVAVGDGVTGLTVGQRVVAIAPGAFRSYVTAQAHLVAPLPQPLSYAAGASIPIAFVTAAYTLLHLADLQAGERVLIHAAAGGVGLAAVQLAQRAGAEVFATAGSEAKRAYLRSLGVTHVFDSRTLAFAEEIKTLTAGRGVDVVLNSLAGEFIPAGLSLLAPGGRFLEIGKSGLLTAEQAAALGHNRRYFAVFLGDQFDQEPQLIQSLLRDLLAGFAAGELQPLPLRRFEFAAAAGAFRFMAQARHIGKLVLIPPGLPQTAADELPATATYLVTGGLGGIGQLLARRLVEWGARNLVLVSRRGEATDGAAKLRAELEAEGVRVQMAAVDVADRRQVAALLAEIQADWPPLRGVFHTAGIVDDGILLQQSWERTRRVLAPKVQGAWNLHLLTQQMPLDFFVCFSSIAGLRGWPGQSSYAAANRFLSSLAYLRHAQGLPALTIDWGAWGDVGMAARLDGGDYTRWTRQGLGIIDPAAGMEALRLALHQPQPHLVITPLNESAAASIQLLGAAQEQPAPAAYVVARQPELTAQWQATPPSLRRKWLLGYIAEQAARTIGLPGDRQIDPAAPLHDLGLDSLMAVELRNVLGAACGATLPATLLFDYPTVETVAAYLQANVPALASATEPASPPPSAKEQPLEEQPLTEMSDADAEALLLAELEQLRSGH